MLTITTDSIDKKVGIEYVMHTNRSSAPKNERVLTEEHRHAGYDEIMIILRGSLFHIAEGTRTFMDSGALCFLPHETSHRLSAPSDDLFFLNLSILPNVLEESAYTLLISNLPSSITFAHAQPYLVEYLLSNHETLTETYDSVKSATIIRNTLNILLPLCSNNAQEKDWFDTLLFQMEKKENFQIGIHRMQELALCSSSHLCRICKARTGLTPTQYIDKTRIKYACNLLKHTTKSIQEICMECGYETLGNFYKCFNTEVGVSPGKFRKT